MPGGLGQRQAHWRGVQAGLGPIRRKPARLVAYPGEAVYEFAAWGHVAEWLRNGLQNRVLRFNSGRGLHL
jgi:hypothetical protein